MATVYRARQDEPKRGVALKVIRADHAADPTYRERFLAEKDTLASLEHQSIVPIYAAGEASGVLYIAMRLVDGADLTAKLIASGRLTLAETISVLEPIADAVDYAHEMGVIHRDLKPSNIILDRRGRPYLTDFGLGKRIDGSRAALSSPGVAVGTLEYMAPEQFTGLSDANLAGRIDIYALACVAFACLAGASPFQRESPERVMYAHAHEAIPSLRAARPDLPASVDAVLAKALAKNPADRFATGHEFISALALAAASAEGQTAAIVPLKGDRSGNGRGTWLRSNRPLAGIAAAVIVALVVIGGGVLAFGPGPSATPSPAGSLTAAASFLTATDGPTIGPTETPTEPPPSDRPTPSPTATPQGPTPTPETPAPTGASVHITSGTVYGAAVNLNLSASRATRMRLGNATNATAQCSFRPWQSYSNTYSGLAISGGTAGTRWVCAQFGNGGPNWSAIVRDSVIFDNRPVAHFFTFDYSDTGYYHDATCATIKANQGFNVTLLPFIATDKDGASTISVTSVTKGSASYTITGGGKGVNIYFNPSSNFTKFVATYNFTVSDNHAGTASGTFVLKVGPCPP